MADKFEFVGTRLKFAEAELVCQNRSFDGLAVISSPEEFNYAIQATKQLR